MKQKKRTVAIKIYKVGWSFIVFPLQVHSLKDLPDSEILNNGSLI